MKVITHRFKRSVADDSDIVYLVNLVDYTGRPLESYIAETTEERNNKSNSLLERHNVNVVQHNEGFSIRTENSTEIVDNVTI
tara:strand:+ start:5899 stop:6144 length:246 start_codon:yes stop_codon:yes gene_type:complete